MVRLGDRGLGSSTGLEYHFDTYRPGVARVSQDREEPSPVDFPQARQLGDMVLERSRQYAHVIEALAGDCASWTSTWKAQIADAAPILIGTSSRSSSKNLPGGSRH